MRMGVVVCLFFFVFFFILFFFIIFFMVGHIQYMEHIHVYTKSWIIDSIYNGKMKSLGKTGDVWYT